MGSTVTTSARHQRRGTWRVVHPTPAHRDRGRLTVWFAILAAPLLAMVGLAFDGPGTVRALQRADNIAAEAARAAGQAIQAGPAIGGGSIRVDPTLAADAALAYMVALDGVTGTIEVEPDRQHLTVTVHVTYDPLLLDLFDGPGPTTVTGRATATLVAT